MVKFHRVHDLWTGSGRSLGVHSVLAEAVEARVKLTGRYGEGGGDLA